MTPTPLPVDPGRLIVEVVAPDWFDWLTFAATAIGSLGAAAAAAVALVLANRERKDRVVAEQRAAELEAQARRANAQLVAFEVHRGVALLDGESAFLETRVVNGQPTSIRNVRVIVTTRPGGLELGDGVVRIADVIPPGEERHAPAPPLPEYMQGKYHWQGRFIDVHGVDWVVDQDGIARESPGLIQTNGPSRARGRARA